MPSKRLLRPFAENGTRAPRRTKAQLLHLAQKMVLDTAVLLLRGSQYVDNIVFLQGPRHMAVSSQRRGVPAGFITLDTPVVSCNISNIKMNRGLTQLSTTFCKLLRTTSSTAQDRFITPDQQFGCVGTKAPAHGQPRGRLPMVNHLAPASGSAPLTRPQRRSGCSSSAYGLLVLQVVMPTGFVSSGSWTAAGRCRLRLRLRSQTGNPVRIN